MSQRLTTRPVAEIEDVAVDAVEAIAFGLSAAEPRGAEPSGERALVAAILLDGLRNARGFLGYTAGASGAELVTRRLRFQAEAREWIASDSLEPPSFRWCCQVLELDADRVRAGVDQVPRALDSRRHGKGLGWRRSQESGVAA